ncbi:MAG: prepilin peptidase [Sphingomonadales bacterium]|nr:prepilin peptidase [Sphingomonadales bacterium]
MSGHPIFSEWISYGLLGLLAIALLVAAATDIHRRQIDNWLNAAIALSAPLFWWDSGLDGAAIAMQVLSASVTLIVLWTMFVLRLMGGGDVKLLAALALWIKPAWFLKLIVLMALIGGALSLLLGAWHLVRRRKDRLSVPYGVAISGAGLWVLGQEYLPLLQLGASG